MNDHKQNLMDDLIAKWLSGEATQLEIEQLNEWITLDPKNRAYVIQLEKIWDNSFDNETPVNIDTEKGFTTVMGKINKQSSSAINMKIAYRISLALAACFGLFVVGRFYIFKPKEFVTPISHSGLFIQAGNEVFTATLPDQTQVLLQPHSTITADTGFGKTNRSIVLTGSAHFSTVHGHKNRFIVKTNDAEIEDIGTAFWVNNTSSQTTVKVTQGSVKVRAYKDSSLLALGDSAVVFRLEKKLKTIASKTVEKVEEVKDKTLVFLKTELRKVTQLLNTTYKVDIRLGNPAIADCKLTASFQNESLDNVLDIIRETFNLEIRNEGNIIYLEGKGCQ